MSFPAVLLLFEVKKADFPGALRAPKEIVRARIESPTIFSNQKIFSNQSTGPEAEKNCLPKKLFAETPCISKA